MNTMAIDQYGHTHHNLGEDPRKALLKQLNAKSAERMYQDTKDGKTYHVGYIIKGLWLVLYNVEPWEKAA